MEALFWVLLIKYPGGNPCAIAPQEDFPDRSDHIAVSNRFGSGSNCLLGRGLTRAVYLQNLAWQTHALAANPDGRVRP